MLMNRRTVMETDRVNVKENSKQGNEAKETERENLDMRECEDT